MRGLLKPGTLMDFFRSFVAYGGADGGASFKIIAAQWRHQSHGAKRAVQRALEALTQPKNARAA